MNVIEYGNELLSKGALTWRRNTKSYRGGLNVNFQMEWPSGSHVFDHGYSQEEIVLISTYKDRLKSPLHFAWSAIFYLREIDNKHDILETIKETEYKEISYKDAITLMKTTNPIWWSSYKELIPENANVYLIWNDGLDIYLAFENEQNYLAWNWSSAA